MTLATISKLFIWSWVCAQSCSTLWPHRLQPTRLLCSRDFPGKNTGVGCHFLLQGIFLTQGLNPCLFISCLACGFFPTKPPGKCKNSSCQYKLVRLEVRGFSYWMITEKPAFPNNGASWIWCVCTRGHHNWVCMCVCSCLILPGCQCHTTDTVKITNNLCETKFNWPCLELTTSLFLKFPLLLLMILPSQ